MRRGVIAIHAAFFGAAYNRVGGVAGELEGKDWDFADGRLQLELERLGGYL